MTTDAVITWVDGADPAHRARLAAHLAERGGKPPRAAHSTRFNDAGELDYCIASILRFAPWLRHLHIVTDQQVPALLARLARTPWAGRVSIVDHRVIFAGFEHHLPTFNSRAIISMLWRIPALAEQFVYFNDDMSLLQPVAEDDFFRDGRMVLRGQWRTQSQHLLLPRIKAWLRSFRGPDAARVGNLDAQQRSARLAGFEDRYYRLFHNPYPMRRSVLATFFDEHPDLLAHNAGYRLRSDEQFKTEVLATHLEIARHEAILDNRLHTVQLKPSEQWLPRMVAKMARADRDPAAAFLVVQSLEMAPAEAQARIAAWLDHRIGRLDTVLADAGATRA